MAYAIESLNYKVLGFKGGVFYQFACSQTMEFSQETEVISTTTINSGSNRTYMTRLTDATLSLGGVMFLRDISEIKWNILETLDQTLINSGLDIKIIWQDQQGATQAITGFVFIKSKSVSGNVGQLTKWNIDFQFSGPITIGAIDTSGVIVAPGAGIGGMAIGSSFIIG